MNANVPTRIARPLRACALIALLAPASVLAGPQQAEIHALVQELDYLIEYAEGLARKYADDAAPVRFNYPALLEQLRVTRKRSAAYLSEVQTVVHPAPPAPVAASLTERR